MFDILTIIEQPAQLSLTLQTGPQGPPGPPGTDAGTQMVALNALGGHRVVVAVGATGAIHADADDLSHSGRVVGVTENAASIGDPVVVISRGYMAEPSWAWTAGEDLWVDTNGLMTQTPPLGAAFVQRIGFAVTPEKIWVELSEPILF